ALWRQLDSGERLAILRHELAHYRRGDLWKSLVARLLALPHWFNPLAWRAGRRFDEAAERARGPPAPGEGGGTNHPPALGRPGRWCGWARSGRPRACMARRRTAGRWPIACGD